MLASLQKKASWVPGALAREAIALTPFRPKRVLFCHIPKCAGTSLGLYLRSCYPSRKIFNAYDYSPKTFKALSPEERRAYRLVIGHDAHYLIDYLADSYVCATVLRDPIQRIVSHYYYVKRKPWHPLYKPIHSNGLTLMEYVSSGLSGELENGITKMFSGMSHDSIRRDPKGAAEHALVKLRQYDMVGVVERLDRFVRDLRQQANLFKPYTNPVLNVSKNKETPSPETLEAIQAFNRADVLLYSMVMRELVEPGPQSNSI